MPYRHKVVQGLHDLLEKYGGGGGDDIIMRSVWWGLKGQVPMILKQLDNSEEAIALIESKLREVLDIKEEKLEVKEIIIEPAPIPVEEIREVVKKAPPKRVRKKAEPVAEFEAVIEPAELTEEEENDQAPFLKDVEEELGAIEPAEE